MRKTSVDGPVVIGGIIILPVTETAIFTGQNRKGLSLAGYKKLLYVVIKAPDGTVISFDPEGRETSVARIIAGHPEITDSLNNRL